MENISDRGQALKQCRIMPVISVLSIISIAFAWLCTVMACKVCEAWHSRNTAIKARSHEHRF